LDEKFTKKDAEGKAPVDSVKDILHRQMAERFEEIKPVLTRINSDSARDVASTLESDTSGAQYDPHGPTANGGPRRQTNQRNPGAYLPGGM
jgi:hypothetical protein